MVRTAQTALTSAAADRPRRHGHGLVARHRRRGGPVDVITGRLGHPHAVRCRAWADGLLLPAGHDVVADPRQPARASTCSSSASGRATRAGWTRPSRSRSGSRRATAKRSGSSPSTGTRSRSSCSKARSEDAGPGCCLGTSARCPSAPTSPVPLNSAAGDYMPPDQRRAPLTFSASWLWKRVHVPYCGARASRTAATISSELSAWPAALASWTALTRSR